ncbi:MAG TPA: FtsX-like permease family protein, partial [Thermomicrobiales bacterium]|nr:FtsX-like permease family protein [Thermomicrobiales bacterium]
GRTSVWPAAAAAGVAVAMVLALVLAQAPLARRPLGELEQDEPVVERIAPRRVVLEALVVALALAGVYLLRRRGITGGSATNDIATMDPWLAAVPVLLGLAVGLLVVRLYPIPARILAWLSSLRRDLVPVLGFRRTSRQPRASSLPVLVLLLALAVSAFALVLTTTIDRGQVAASWQQVGADYRVTAGPAGSLYRGVDPSGVEGVEPIARAVIIPDAIFAGRVPGTGIARLMLVEPARLQEVTAGTLADAHIPDDMTREQTGVDIGQPTNPIPAIISPTAGNGTLGPGDTFSMTVLSRETTFVVVEVRERFAGLPIDRAFVVAPLPSITAINPDRPVHYTDMFVRGPRSIAAPLHDTLREQSQSADLTSRAAVYDAIHDAPLIAGVATGFRLGLAATALYAGVAVAFAMLLRGKARARDQAYLRTLGLSREQSLGLTAVEQGPGIVVGIAAGVALGLASAWLIAPGLDLIEFVGPGLPVRLQVDWGAVALLVVIVLVVTVAAVLLTTRFARKISLGEVLRLGDR